MGAFNSEVQNSPGRHGWLALQATPSPPRSTQLPLLQIVSTPLQGRKVEQACPSVGRLRQVPEASQYRLP
jgi:hypothetical protein